MKDKLRSPVVWSLVLTNLVVMVGILFNEGVAMQVKIVGGCILSILNAFGILNNPDSRDSF